MTEPDRAAGGFRRSPSLLTIGGLGMVVLALVSAPIVARAIGPQGRGQTAAAQALFLIVPVALGLGIPLEVRRQSATSDGHAVMRTARILVALSTAAALAIAALAYFTIFSSFGTEGRAVATLGIVLAPLSTSWALDVSVLVAHRRYGAVFLMQLLHPSIYVTLILLFWTLDIATVATVLTASIAATAATFCAGQLLVRVPIRGQRVGTKALLRQGLAFFGSAVAEAASSRADQVLALPLIGAYQAGLYSVAATIGSVPLPISYALGASYFAPMAQEQGERRLLIQSDAIRAAVAVALMTVPLIAIAAWMAIPLVFGIEFSPSVPVTMIALLGSAAMLAAYVASMALAADGRGIRMTIAQLGSLITGIAGLVVLGPVLGAIGAAIASTIGYFTLLAVLLVSLQLPPRSLIPHPRDFVRAIKRLRRD